MKIDRGVNLFKSLDVFADCLTFGPRHFRDHKEVAKFHKKLSFMLSRDIFL